MENEKTFTQEEVNKIVSKRLTEERAKLEKEYTARALNDKARSILKEKGFNPDLANALKFDDEETLQQSIGMLTERDNKINAYKGYEPNGGNGAPTPRDSIREAFGLPQGRNYAGELAPDGVGRLKPVKYSSCFPGTVDFADRAQEYEALKEKHKSWMGDKT